MPKPTAFDLLYCPLHVANVRYEQARLISEAGQRKDDLPERSRLRLSLPAKRQAASSAMLAPPYMS